jgi:hypothetical protein
MGRALTLPINPLSRNKQMTKKKQIDQRLLGTISDEELAKQSGYSRNAISLRRRRLKIPPFSKSSQIDITLLGKISDVEVE